MDLKNGSGSVGSGEPKSPADVSFTLKDGDFHKLFAGKLKPASAFMTGQLKLSGDMGKAMRLDKLMSQMRGFHTTSRHMNGNDVKYTNVPEVKEKL